MATQSILSGVIGLLVGLLVMGIFAVSAVNSQNTGMMRMVGMNTGMRGTGTPQPGGHETMSMNDMSNTLQDKRGDDFDRNFISMMIAHHQGAVRMADLAKQYAKHDELKRMADEIISAQTKEISQMQAWQSQWGYASDASMPGMNH